MTTEDINSAQQALRDRRQYYATLGHDVSRVAIGRAAGELRVCDDSGACNLFRDVRGNWTYKSVGCVTMTTLGIVLDTVAILV